VFTTESGSGRLLKIGRQLAKLWARVGCSVSFYSQGAYICKIWKLKVSSPIKSENKVVTIHCQ